METHVKVLGVMFIVFGALGVLVGLGFLVFFGGLAGVASTAKTDAAQAAPLLGLVGILFFAFTCILALPWIIAGWGLLKFREWARILGIVLSALSLPGVPVGTALGIYGLWTLLNQETLPLFRRVKPAS